MDATVTLYGIPNCDTVKKARAWLAAQGIDHRFHDWRKDGVPEALDDWVATLGWPTLLNCQGLTWRRLDSATQAGVTDARSATALMRAQPAVIRRPVVVWPGGRVTVGFSADAWRKIGT